MITNWVICGALGLIAGIFIVRSRHYKKNWKYMQNTYAKRCRELYIAQDEVKKLKLENKSLVEENEYIKERIEEYIHLSSSGYRNLKVKEFKLPALLPQFPKYSVSVVGQDTKNPDLYFLVKTFEAVDDKDREFAIREAEELIETIQKA